LQELHLFELAMSELDTPANARAMPKENQTLERLLGYERF
jgi:hypothetical protein